MTVLDIITREQLKALREAGYVVVHREPTHSMISAGIRNQWPEERSVEEVFHRMIGESIRLQNKEIRERVQ